MMLRLTRATEADFERLLALRIASMRESLERIGRFEPQRSRDYFRGSFRADDMSLICDGDELVGCVAVRPEGPSVRWIEHFYIDPKHQSRGVGAEIMRRFAAEADRSNTTLRLGVLRESDANRFYQRHGFVETHREEWDIYYERAPSPR